METKEFDAIKFLDYQIAQENGIFIIIQNTGRGDKNVSVINKDYTNEVGTIYSTLRQIQYQDILNWFEKRGSLSVSGINIATADEIKIDLNQYYFMSIRQNIGTEKEAVMIIRTRLDPYQYRRNVVDHKFKNRISLSLDSEVKIKIPGNGIAQLIFYP